MSKLILLRHGQAFNQKLNVLAGDVNFPLTKIGLEQARMLASRYQKILHGVKTIYCSSVDRCVQTITPFYRDNSYVKFELTDRLREINVGDSYVEDYSDVINEERMHAFGYARNMRFENGETLREFISRVKGFVNELPNDSDCLLVSHSGFINVVFHEFYKIDYNLFPFFNIHNCYPYVIERK